jgi:hypothetical protein
MITIWLFNVISHYDIIIVGDFSCFVKWADSFVPYSIHWSVSPRDFIFNAITLLVGLE